MLPFIPLAAWEANLNPTPANNRVGPHKNIVIPLAVLSTVSSFLQRKMAPSFWVRLLVFCFLLQAWMVTSEEDVVHHGSFIVSFLPGLSWFCNWPSRHSSQSCNSPTSYHSRLKDPISISSHDSSSSIHWDRNDLLHQGDDVFVTASTMTIKAMISKDTL